MKFGLRIVGGNGQVFFRHEGPEPLLVPSAGDVVSAGPGVELVVMKVHLKYIANADGSLTQLCVVEV